MRYILYARKSSESEDRQIQSIDDQLSVLRQLAQQRSLRVVEEIVESKSAKAPGGRPAFARMLARVESGEADAILCWSVNRLSRNPIDSGALSWMLQTGVLQSILTPEREYRPEDNVVLMAVESSFANQYILDLRRNVARGTRSKVEKGWYPHRAPAGYCNNIVDKTIEVDRERFALLREAWEMMLTGAHTVPQVLDDLTRRGYRTRNTKRSGGKELSRSALFQLFGNPFYMGEFVFEGRRVQGAHPPMVSGEEFARVQRLLGRDGHAQPQKQEWAFTGLIRCGLCGSMVTAERKIKHAKLSGVTREYVYYHCTGRRCHPKTCVSEAYIEERIAEVLERCTVNKSFARWCVDCWTRYEGELGNVEEMGARQSGRALVEAERRRDRLFDMRADGEITKEEFAARKARLDVEIEKIEEGLSSARTKTQREQEALERVMNFCGTAYERFTRGKVRDKREVAHALGGQMSLTLGKLEIRPHPLVEVICCLEPTEKGSDKQKQGTAALPNPTWWAMRDHIRTVLDKFDADGAELLFPIIRTQL